MLLAVSGQSGRFLNKTITTGLVQIRKQLRGKQKSLMVSLRYDFYKYYIHELCIWISTLSVE